MSGEAAVPVWRHGPAGLEGPLEGALKQMCNRPTLPLCVLGLALICARPATAAEPVGPGWLSPSQIICHVVRVANAPDVEAAQPLSDSLWQQAEPIGPLFRKGRPEDPERATTVRILCCQGKLYIAARCLDPAPDQIKTGTDVEKVWQDDSLELVFTGSTDRKYPYTHLQLSAAGLFRAAHIIQPFVYGRGPLKQAVDPATCRVRAGKDDQGWWAVLVLPLEQLRIEGQTFLANIVRNRPADDSDAAWSDLWGGSIANVQRFQPMTIVDALPPPGPRLAVPAGLAVGDNTLHWLNWSAAYTMTVNGKQVPVEPSGDCIARISERGTGHIRVVSPEGKTVIAYTTEVPRPLLIEAVEPFQQDASRPIAVDITLNTAAASPVDVSLTAGWWAGKPLASKVFSLSNGRHTLDLPHKIDTPGEVVIAAAANILDRAGKPIASAGARHWCVLGQTRESLDKYRDGLADLQTVAMYRASLADACNFFHVLQAGDGQYRSIGRRDGRLGTNEWNFSMVYAFAVVYAADWPENPYRGDPRMLASAIAGMEAGLAPETWYDWLGHPPNRQLQAYLLTYELLKDKVPPELAQYWRDRLVRMMEAAVDRWIEPATYEYSFFSENTGTGTNHYAYHLANVYTAGRIFGRQDWLDLARTMMRRLVAHERDGFFPEQRQAVVIHYTWLTVNAVGEYYWQSGDETILPHLMRCADFAWRVSLPPTGSQLVILHDSRNNEPNGWGCGEFVLSLTPQGRWLSHQRILQRIASGRISRSSPEFWFRTAENALYFRPGPQEPPPAEFEYGFLDGRAVIARSKTFTYGMSAICARPTDETYRVDQQNAVELNHERAGRILSGANSQQQPEAGSFFRKLKDRTVFLPWEGVVERTARGHAVRLVFDTFEAQVFCDVLTPWTARITVQLLKADGGEPVIYSFFPVAAGAAEFRADDPVDVLQFQGVRIRCSQPVQIQRDFKIMDPYSQTLRVTSKPLRAYTTLRTDKPFVLDVTVDESAPPATQPPGR
jgi:hypothetical protein